MPVDWFGIGISALIIIGIILIVIAKMQGDRVVDVLEQFLEFMRGNK